MVLAAGYIRIYDVTNNKIICENSFTSSSDVILDLGILSNLPTDEAIWEIQMKVNNTLYNATCSYVDIIF